jgi:PAS domain S-box-containing protein
MPRIFAVEDDEFFVKVLTIGLKKGGYELAGVVASGEEAIQQAKNVQPDLVLMDMGLSGTLDGIDTAEQIRTVYGIPVIFLTSSDDQDLLHRAKYVEPFAYLAKPFRQQDLVSAIEIALYKHEVEKKLKQREAWLATTLRCVGDGMIVTDGVGRIEFINEIAKRIFGIKEIEVVGRPFADIVTLKSRLTDSPAGDLVQLAVLQGGTMDIGKDLRVASSLQGDVDLEGEISLSEVQGAIVGSVFTFRDTTIRQHEEEQHRQGLRKRAVTQLAGAVATDLKHLQKSILSSVQQVLDQATVGQPIHRSVEAMKTRCADAMSRVLRQLAVLQRKEVPLPQSFDLNALIIETHRGLRLDIPTEVELVAQLSPGLGNVFADRNHLKQAITSLTLYLRDSLPEGGRILTATRNCGLELRGRAIPANKYIRLVIGSTGAAIRNEQTDENELSDPLSDVTSLSEDLDVRLFTVYGAIADSRGSISTKRTRGQRLTFEIVLQQSSDRSEQLPTAPEVVPQSEAPAVLLVEKDNDIRDLVLTALDGTGFEALGARDASEALDWIDLYAAPVALLVTELNMPEISGVSLAERMILRHPHMRAVFIVDRTVDPALCEEWKTRGASFLERPFRLDDLLEVINGILAPKRSSNVQRESKGISCLAQ